MNIFTDQERSLKVNYIHTLIYSLPYQLLKLISNRRSDKEYGTPSMHILKHEILSDKILQEIGEVKITAIER